YGVAVSAVAAGSVWAAQSWAGGPAATLATTGLRVAVLALLAMGAGSVRRRLEDASRTDPLTGLWNERAFREALMIESSRQQRYRRPFGVIYTDLDDFGTFCLREGEYAGEQIVVRLARTISVCLRRSDVIALPHRRGDELLVLLPETPG